MFKMKPQVHTWKEYQYRHANDNEAPNRRMWMRDDEAIHETANGFSATKASGIMGYFTTFEDAEKAFSASSK